MISQEIRTNTMALGAIMHELNEDQAAVIRIIRQNLMAVADLAGELEGKLYAPISEAPTKNKVAAVGLTMQDAARALDLRELRRGRIVAVVTKGCAGECDGCIYAQEAANG